MIGCHRHPARARAMAGEETMGKVRLVGTWTCVIVLAAAFVLVGTSKLRGPSAARWRERFAHWGFPAHAPYVVGVLEVLGGLGLLTPKSRRAAAATLMVLMIGALLTHVVNGEPLRVVPPLVLAGLALVVYRGPLPRPPTRTPI